MRAFLWVQAVLGSLNLVVLLINIMRFDGHLPPIGAGPRLVAGVISACMTVWAICLLAREK